MINKKKRTERKQLAVRVICAVLALLLVGSSLAAIFGIY